MGGNETLPLVSGEGAGRQGGEGGRDCVEFMATYSDCRFLCVCVCVLVDDGKITTMNLSIIILIIR